MKITDPEAWESVQMFYDECRALTEALMGVTGITPEDLKAKTDAMIDASGSKSNCQAVALAALMIVRTYVRTHLIETATNPTITKH